MEQTIDVGYVAQLARLEISDSDRAELQRDLESIVGHIAQLRELDVDGIEPTAHAAALGNVWREDAARESFPRAVMLSNAPATVKDELIRVPQVLAEEGMN